MLPDITVLGPWTYLATEVVFGAIALALLVRADALVRAGRTILALYPIAYLWDWYTLEVGVFAIPMRTGVELAGIPLEEHVFILVVPALVVGIHETVNDRSGSRTAHELDAAGEPGADEEQGADEEPGADEVPSAAEEPGVASGPADPELEPGDTD